jgi:PAS domain S-box-containing protein
MKIEYKILVIEDNPGDFALVEEFLFEKIESPSIIHAKNFKDAKEILLLKNDKFDAVLLDLSLPDKKGEELILEMIAICLNTPIIVLTGYADFEFGIKSLSLGISDYILKEELTALSLYKSIIYSLERKKGILSLEESEKKYSQLFHLSPLPMWVVDIDTLHFLDVNVATIRNYGYTREEFLSMTLKDIRLVEDDPILEHDISEGKKKTGLVSQYIVVHRKKNGDLRNVEIQIAPLQFKGINANIAIATDITERLKYIKAIEEQNEKLKEIAWVQSHVVRAPLARMMGLIHVIKDIEEDLSEKEKILDYIVLSANELDGIIKDISDKTSMVKY